MEVNESVRYARDSHCLSNMVENSDAVEGDGKKQKRLTDQCEAVVGPHQLLYAMLFQHHHSSQRRALGSGTVLAVHHVALLGAVLAGDEQQIEHLDLGTQHCGSHLVLQGNVILAKVQHYC